jgi:hypothetical protein
LKKYICPGWKERRSRNRKKGKKRMKKKKGKDSLEK